MVNSLRPLTDVGPDPVSAQAGAGNPQKMYVRLKSERSREFERLKLLLEMFPGEQQLIIYFEDTRRRLGTSCIIYPSFVTELRQMLGEENVVLK